MSSSPQGHGALPSGSSWWYRNVPRKPEPGPGSKQPLLSASVEPPTAAETTLRHSAQGCTQQNCFTFLPPAPLLEVILGQCMGCRTGSSSPGWKLLPLGTLLGSPARTGTLLQPRCWSCCDLYLRAGRGYGAGGGQLQEGPRGHSEAPSCWLQATPLRHLPGCTGFSGVDGGLGNRGLFGELWTLGLGHQRSQPVERAGVQNHSTTWEAKMSLSATSRPASSLHYSLLSRLSENPRKSHA